MKPRISSLLAASLIAAAAAAPFPAAQAAGEDKVYSTTQAPASRDAKSVSTSQVAPADPASEAVKERLGQRFPGMAVTAVRRTPYGLFEVQLGMDLIYTDEKVTWVMDGTLIDAMTRRDVTRESLERLSAVSFADLPLDLAIKQVKGNGARKVAIFEDPNCGYCKQLRKTLEDVSDVTIYTFLYPILSPDSKTKVRDVWCADNPGQAWDDWMLRGKRPATAQCDAPEDKLLALGQRLMVRGTPTLFFADGSRVSGALPLDQIKARLN
ncbi:MULTISPECIES: DsbC family protein [unclassified Achromobacter]|uniref:DsbC family protein n=1 Tax=unclassified Achromobacter TaxID=2626865 RepID=UPI00069E234A|nr:MULTISPECIES: DsbC family protein [unclassified Achromobacter]KOF54088.1 disulfide bond formation protein DsbC [Achromobacter sp. DMS1]